jgi:hypothetical protein
MSRERLQRLLIACAAALFAVMLLKHLAYPLFWADEAETAMFGERVLDYGYPRVHGPRNVVYQFGPNIALGVKEGPDAYIGTTWGQFYFATPGLLWARGTDDPYARTLRVRLPFALAGMAGVALWLWALLPALADDAGRRRRFAALYLLLTALSVSLLLHLREARYYSLLVLLAGGLARVHLGYAVYGDVGWRRWATATSLLLFAVFQVFFQAFFSFGALLFAERLLALVRGRAGPRDLAPLVAAGLLVAPFVVFFETFSTAAAFARGLSFGLREYLGNLGLVAAHLLRHEMLAPALLCRVAVLASGAGSPRLRRVSALLLGFAAGYAALGCLNPLPLERYFVVLSPALTGLFLLDAGALVAAAAERARRPRRSARWAAAGLVLLTLVLRLPAWPELRGRVEEITTPYRGPLDFVIPHLLETEPHPERLVLATNYEELAFMYYLGSRVIVGLTLNNLAHERALEPDVVVPRRRWPRSLRELGPFLRRGEWEERRFPVRDLHTNNVPALSRSRFIPDPHRFRTAATDDPDAQLVIYRRASSSKRTGTSSSP